MKVIHILYHSESPRYQNWEFDLFFDGFHVRTAQQIWKRVKKYQHECWRPERKLKKIITGEKDGIIYRAFPSIHINHTKEYSPLMLRELKKQCREEKILIHLASAFNDLTYLIGYSLPNVPIVSGHLGGVPYTFNLFTFVYQLPLSIIERSLLKRIDKILISSQKIYDAFSKFSPNVILCMPLGVDFNEFKPLEKQEARSKLGFPSNKKLLLHVGRFYQYKGLEIILNTYKELKNMYDVELIVIGGQKNDHLFGKLVESGAIVKERIPNLELIPYYSAADVYLLPKVVGLGPIEKVRQYSGIGIAPLESLACGTPVVGTTLRHFLGNDEELKKVGKIPKSTEDVVRCVSEIFDDPSLYKNCRDIARKYYDWEVIVKSIINIYDELFEKYYVT